METAVFACSICGDDSTEICVYCTKDACGNHLCERCHRCSDCCQCDMPLTKASKETGNFTPRFAAPPPAAEAPDEPAETDSHTAFPVDYNTQ